MKLLGTVQTLTRSVTTLTSKEAVTVGLRLSRDLLGRDFAGTAAVIIDAPCNLGDEFIVDFQQVGLRPQVQAAEGATKESA